MKIGLWILVLFLYISLQGQENESPKEKILFSCTYENGLNADIANGNGYCKGNAPLSEDGHGKTGKAVILSRQPSKYTFVPGMGFLTYDALDNIDLEKGTLTLDIFFFSLENLQPGRFRIFTFRNLNNESIEIFFEVRKDKTLTPLWVWIKNKDAYVTINYPMSNLTIETWYQLTLAWDDDGYRFYINNRKIGNCGKISLGKANGTMVLGDYNFSGMADNFTITNTAEKFTEQNPSSIKKACPEMK